MLPRSITPLLFALVCTSLLPPCVSNDDFEKRMDKRNSTYDSFDDRRRIRLDARQERTDKWYDRVLGTSKGETGIRTGL